MKVVAALAIAFAIWAYVQKKRSDGARAVAFTGFDPDVLNYIVLKGDQT